MTTTSGHSFYIGPIDSFYNQVNDTGSWEPLVYLYNSYETIFKILSWSKLLSDFYSFIIFMSQLQGNGLFVCLMVFNATFNNISIISWRSVLLVEEIWGHGENHRPVASHWQTLPHNVVHLTLIKIRTHSISGDWHWLHK